MAQAEFYRVTTPPRRFKQVLLLFYSTKGIAALEEHKKEMEVQRVLWKTRRTTDFMRFTQSFAAVPKDEACSPGLN